MNMKIFLVLLIFTAGLSVVYAKTAPIRKLHNHKTLRTSRLLHDKPLVGKDTWKPIIATGAAGAAVVAAYKLSDGVEDGLRTAAREDPKAFMGSINWMATPVLLFAVLLCIFVLYRLLPNIKQLLQKQKGKNL